MKQSLRYRDIIEEDFNSEVNRLIAKERRQAGPKPMSAVNFLADILGLYKLQPKYELKQIKGSLLQCRVWFDNHSGMINSSIYHTHSEDKTNFLFYIIVYRLRERNVKQKCEKFRCFITSGNVDPHTVFRE